MNQSLTPTEASKEIDRLLQEAKKRQDSLSILTTLKAEERGSVHAYERCKAIVSRITSLDECANGDASANQDQGAGATAPRPVNIQPIVIKSIQDLKPYKDVLGLGDRYWLFIGTKGSSFLFTFDNSKEQRFEEKLLTNAEVQDFINLGRFFRHFWLPIRFHTNLTSPGDPQS